MSVMVVTDLDGTLLGSGRSYDPRDLETLEALGRRGVVRCIATGRSPYSARQAIAPSMPIDYLIFSSGAGILEWAGGALVSRELMTVGQVQRAFDALAGRGLDFMVHDPVPENHCFTWYARRDGVADFRRRIERYRSFARRGDLARFTPSPSTQLLAVVEAGEAAEGEFSRVRDLLSGLSVLRSTSPLDGASLWIEVFAPGVSKSRAAALVAERHSIRREQTVAVGNDYNDEDLLEWAGQGMAASGAPQRLRDRFRTVGENETPAFTEAVHACGLLDPG